MKKKAPEKKMSRLSANLRLYFLALSLFVAVLQPHPAHAQVGGTCFLGVCSGAIEQFAIDAFTKVISTIGNILQPIVAKIQSMAADVRSTFEADRHSQDSENQEEAKKAADGTLPTDSSGAPTTTACANNVTLPWVREGAASAVTGLNARLGGLEAARGKGQGGQEGTPAVAAEKNCALSGNGWTFVDAKTYGPNNVPKPCTSQ